MADDLPDNLPAAAEFALAVALGCAYILQPILDFVNGMSPRSAVLDLAVAVALVTLPATYLMGLVLLYVHVTPPAAPGAWRRRFADLASPLPAAPAPGAWWRRFADLACALAFSLLVAVAAFLLLVAAGGGVGSPPGGPPPT